MFWYHMCILYTSSYSQYSMSATSYFAAFWQLLTPSIPCREHHSFTVGCEVHAEFIYWQSQISDYDINTFLSINCDKIQHDCLITKIWAGLITWGSKISDLHGIWGDYFFLSTDFRHQLFSFCTTWAIQQLSLMDRACPPQSTSAPLFPELFRAPVNKKIMK